MTESNSGSNIMSVAEMIDTAFGEPEVNTVNHKLIQTILFILARQLRILERRVEIEIGPAAIQPSSSSLSVTEVKVHAMQKKKKRPARSVISGTGGGRGAAGGRGPGRGGMGGGGLGRGGIGGGMGGAGAGQGPGRGGPQGGQPVTMDEQNTLKGQPASLSDKTASDKTSTEKSSDKTSSQRTASDKTSSEKTKSSTGKSISEKTISDKTASDKTTSDKTTSDKTTSDKTTSDKTTSDKTTSDKTTSDKTTSDKTTSDKTTSDKTASDKTASDKTTSDKTTSDKTISDKTTSDKTTSDKTASDKTASDKTTSDKTTSDKTTSDKTTSDKTNSDLTSTDKTSSDKTSSDKTTSDKTTSDKTTSDKTSSGKTSTDKTSSDKTTSDKTSSGKTTTDKMSSDKTTSGKTSSDKTSSYKTTSEQTSSDKTSTEKSSDKTSSDKTSSDKRSSSDKISSEPISSDKTSSKDKSSSDKRSTTTSSKSTTDKTSTEKSSSGKTTTDTTSSSKRGPGYFAKLLEAIEEQRETELRVIHQRADSHEEHDKTPSPMASLDSVEATYEKLLVVERIPADEARALAAKGRSGARDKAPRISVVTQEQFEDLAKVVRKLQQKFGPVGSASFPENIQLMKELRKGASLTDAMAALQLSARLEASEKAMKQMMALVTELASKTPGIDLTGGIADGADGGGGAGGTGENVQVLYGSAGPDGGGSGKDTPSSRKSPAFQKQAAQSRKEPSPQATSSEESMIIPLPQPGALGEVVAPSTVAGETEDAEKEKPDRITYEELDNAMQELYDDIIKMVNTLTTKSAVNADNAFKLASKLEGKLEASLDLGTRMHDLEALVTDYSEQINILDTSLSSQMTNYQEELTQMQHDLETALETMAEVLANTGGDTTAVAELNAQFSNLQSDIDDTMMRQKDLRNTQNCLELDLDSLRKQIELLRDAKADRDEVADALRDKAGLGALNGLVSLQQFSAVRGDIEKRIGAAYDKFNSQETIWQKAIDELLRELNEKADLIQVISLKEEIGKHLEILRCRLNAIMEIVGEPRAAAVAKKLHRDATCLSCATPADMELEEHGVVPALPAMRPPAIGAEAATPKEDGDHKTCYPGLPIPHPRDPRAHVCQRWCGGSHTVVSNTVSRVPPSMIITRPMRQVTTALGTDGKTYMVDETIKPCAQCKRQTTPQSSIAEKIQERDEDIGSNMTPSDFRTSFGNAFTPAVVPENETPPAPLDDY